MEIKRKNPKVFETIIARVKDLDGKVGKAGWFHTSRYADGTPVAYIAAIQEFGVHINHPGGTPYRIGEDGRAVFVSRPKAPGLKPPRPTPSLYRRGPSCAPPCCAKARTG